MNIGIVGINSKYIHSSLAPWCLHASAKKRGVDSKVVEGTINESREKLIDRFTKEKWDLLCFSSYIWNIERIREILPKIKERQPDCKILLGGPEVAYRQKEILKSWKDVDYILSGEGEEDFARLVMGQDQSAIKSLSYRNGEMVVVGTPYIGNEDPPSPYCLEYFEKLKGRIAYIEASRGCPYSCAFCLSSRCGGARYFSLERIKEEILLLGNSGARTIKFVDRTFNANEKRAIEIIQYILENYDKKMDETVCFHFEMAGDIMSETLISLLGKAPKGLFQLEIGMQSFHEPTLEQISRKTNTTKLKENIRKLVAFGNMHIHIDLIAGLPLEDLNQFKESFNTGFYLGSQMLQLGFLKLLYGAPMRENPKEFPCTYKKMPPYEVEETPWLTKEDMQKLEKVEDGVERMYNSGRFFKDHHICSKDFPNVPL